MTPNPDQERGEVLRRFEREYRWIACCVAAIACAVFDQPALGIIFLVLAVVLARRAEREANRGY